VKANATRFTVWPFWPLRYSPLFREAAAQVLYLGIPHRAAVLCWLRDDVWGSPRSEQRQENAELMEADRKKLAVGVEPTTAGLQNRSSAN
jgi:hypothetical protein